jgi:hypothetical protein
MRPDRPADAPLPGEVGFAPARAAQTPFVRRSRGLLIGTLIGIAVLAVAGLLALHFWLDWQASKRSARPPTFVWLFIASVHVDGDPGADPGYARLHGSG